MNMSEIISSNQYKGALISVDMASLFTIYSDLFIGFTTGNFPKDFSIDTIPYLYPYNIPAMYNNYNFTTSEIQFNTFSSREYLYKFVCKYNKRIRI